jgi:SAM-dependent methyltransferase
MSIKKNSLIKRFFKIMILYPKITFWFTVIKLFQFIPIIKVKHIREKEGIAEQKKTLRKQNQEYVGHYNEEREIIFEFFNFKLFSVNIKGKKQNNLLHFFLLRNTKKFNSNFYKEFYPLIYKEPNPIVFEPGCNTGKMLTYFKDTFNAQIIGADIDEPSIEIANEICDKTDKFYCVDTVNSDFLQKFKNKEITLTILSSHLVHTLHYPNFERYISELLRISKYILIHEKYNERLIETLKKLETKDKSIQISQKDIKAFIITN